MGSCSSGPRSPAGLPFAAALRTPNASTADPTPEPSEARMANVRPSSIAELWHPIGPAGQPSGPVLTARSPGDSDLTAHGVKATTVVLALGSRASIPVD